jgi:Calcineurin-like phosphoesterase
MAKIFSTPSRPGLLSPVTEDKLRLFLIGDVHQHTDRYLRLLANLPPCSRSVALGDLYLGRPNVHLPELPAGHKFIRGNHDDPTICKQHPGYLGDFGYLPADDLFFISGAQTASWRVLGNSRYWYRDEELSTDMLDAALKLYQETKPSIVISHDAPTEAVREVLDGLTGNYFAAKAETLNSQTCFAFQRMFEANPPERWFFGHYHINREFMLRRTKFRALAELSVCEMGLITSGFK